jgi:hypothetical protein
LKPVFDHVFAPGFRHRLGDERPFFAVLHYELNEELILGRVPLTVEHSRIEAVAPFFSALLGSPEELLARIDEEGVGHFNPLSLKVAVPEWRQGYLRMAWNSCSSSLGHFYRFIFSSFASKR